MRLKAKVGNTLKLSELEEAVSCVKPHTPANVALVVGAFMTTLKPGPTTVREFDSLSFTVKLTLSVHISLRSRVGENVKSLLGGSRPSAWGGSSGGCACSGGGATGGVQGGI